MGKLIAALVWVVFFTAFLAAVGCSGSKNQGNDVGVYCEVPISTSISNPDIPWQEGVISWVDSDGGFYGITVSVEKHFEPLNLSPEFQHQGFPVLFKSEIVSESVTHNWGTPVNITAMVFET
jgi:hypothetical protein